MKSSKTYILLIVIAYALLVASISEAFQTKRREFSRTKEKDLQVLVNVSFGDVTVERGGKDNIAVVEYDEEESEKQKLYISYSVEDESGRLRIKLKESTHFSWDSDERSSSRRHLNIQLSDAVPISFEIEFGAGRGDINLTDLQVRDLKITTGASSVILKCGKPNPLFADEIVIESGVSKFTGSDLGNLNFRKLKFSGGVGSYKLDFSGKFNTSGDAEIEVGLGSIVVYVPKNIPTKLLYDENWLSSYNIDDDFVKQRSGVYVTDGFKDAFKRFTVRLQSGLGSVKVHRK